MCVLKTKVQNGTIFIRIDKPEYEKVKKDPDDFFRCVDEDLKENAQTERDRIESFFKTFNDDEDYHRSIRDVLELA